MKNFLKVIMVVILLGLSISFVIIGNGYKLYQSALNEMSIQEKIERIEQKEHYTKIEEVPQMYIDAVISVEDHRFYQHKGVDFIAIGRAVINDIKAMSFAEGGSTITQQLAKNIYFTQEKKLERKIAEVFMARKIEKNYDKDKILELYLNTSYFGDGYYTIKEACRRLFWERIRGNDRL